MSRPRPPRPEGVEARPPAPPACRTCPFWERTGELRGVCRGWGPVAQVVSGAVFPVTSDSDWCRLHPQAPSPQKLTTGAE